jgi:hypothetical protein
VPNVSRWYRLFDDAAEQGGFRQVYMIVNPPRRKNHILKVPISLLSVKHVTERNLNKLHRNGLILN